MATMPDDQHIQTKYCASCCGERLEELLKDDIAVQVASTISFSHCGHFPYLNDHEQCNVCYRAVGGWFSVMAGWAYFTNKRLGSRLKIVQAELRNKKTKDRV